MDRLTVRPRRFEAGVTLMELLVTMVLAGIIFSAMVPMFVTAQQRNVSDTMRNVSMRLAQDRIEKIRQLDYDDIRLANLQSSSFFSGQFGTTVNAEVGATNKLFNVAYSVQNYPVGAADGTEQYRVVRVTVSWDAPPSPVKPAVLQTVIYKQYAGPTIYNLTISPRTADEDGWLTSNSNVITAKVASPDIATCQFVRLAVLADNGAEVASKNVYKPGSDITGKPNAVISSSVTPGEYRWTWDASAAPDAVYTFTATGFAGAYAGNTYPIVARLERGAPEPPTNFAATGGNGLVSLTWVLSASSDVASYEVWRGTTSGSLSPLVTALAPTTAAHTDLDVTNGTTYYYQVYAIDSLGRRSAPTPELAATPAAPVVDTNPPTVSNVLTVSQVAEQPSLALIWSVSTDDPPPATPSGLANYLVYRCATNSANEADWTLVYTGADTVTAWTDTTAGYGQTWWYKVRTVDVVGNISAFGAGRSGTSVSMPRYSLIVKNARTATNRYIYVWVRDAYASPVIWYTQAGVAQGTRPAAVSINSKGATKTWSNLPPGTYVIEADYDNNGTADRQQTATLPPGGQTITFGN